MRALALAAPHAIMATMRDEPDPSELDLDGFYERYLKTCAMSGVTPVSRERAFRLGAGMERSASGAPGADGALVRSRHRH